MKPEINLPEILRQRRREANMVQREVAQRLNLTTGCYGSYEEGRATPDIFTLIRIATVFGYGSLDRFLEIANEDLITTLPVLKAYYSGSEEERRIIDRILNIAK